LRVLEERRVPINRIGAFASRARETPTHFRGETIPIRATTDDALRQYAVVFFASGEDSSETFVPILRSRGTVVIDNSATFRMRPDVPLVVPEINADTIAAEHRIFPVANCTAIILCMALAPIRDVAGLRSIRVATYQAVSGAGRAALEEFDRGEGPIVGNVIPQIGSVLDENGESGEERKVRDETRKMLGMPDLPIESTCVRVPVRTAHSEAVSFETELETTIDELSSAFERTPGLVFHREGIVTPRDVEGKDEVHVARLRAEVPCASLDRLGMTRSERTTRFSFWCVGDQLRKGAATNAVQILELLLAKGYVR
jgi:aspartate-semialdehyde dehydrogenase